MSVDRLDSVLVRTLRALASHPDLDGKALARLGRAVDVASQLPTPPQSCRVSIRVSQEIDASGVNATVLRCIDFGTTTVLFAEHASYTIREEFRSESEKTIVGSFRYGDSLATPGAMRISDWLQSLEQLIHSSDCRVWID